MMLVCKRYREIEHTIGYYEEVYLISGHVNNDCIGISARAKRAYDLTWCNRSSDMCSKSSSISHYSYLMLLQ